MLGTHEGIQGRKGQFLCEPGIRQQLGGQLRLSYEGLDVENKDCNGGEDIATLMCWGNFNVRKFHPLHDLLHTAFSNLILPPLEYSQCPCTASVLVKH